MKDQKLEGDAFESIVQRYGKAIFNAAFRIVNDYEDAMDITQTAFIKAFENRSRYNPSHSVFSWIYKIAVNEAITCARRRSRTVELESDTCIQFRNPETEYVQNESSAQLQQALMKLSLEYRVVLILRHFHALSYKAMADILGIPEKTVKSRLFTGRRLLRDALVHEGYTP